MAHDPRDDAYTLHVCMQGVTTMRRHLSAYTGVAEDRLHFEVRDIGGGFGQRTPAYPEYCALMIAARETGRPVKWVFRSKRMRKSLVRQPTVWGGMKALGWPSAMAI